MFEKGTISHFPEPIFFRLLILSSAIESMTDDWCWSNENRKDNESDNRKA